MTEDQLVEQDNTSLAEITSRALRCCDHPKGSLYTSPMGIGQQQVLICSRCSQEWELSTVDAIFASHMLSSSNRG